MSEKLDERVVKLEFDNAKFEKNVKQTQKSLKELDEQLAFKDGTDGIERVEASFSHFQIVAFTVISRITNKVIDLGVRLVKSLSVDNISAGWTKFGEKTTSVATMAAQKIKIAGRVIDDYSEKMEVINDQLDKLNWFTDETSYNFTDMVDNIGKFTAAGRSLDESVKAMMGIANWAALSGQNAATASRAMYQLSQALGKGYVQLIDWKSIQTANMDTEEFREKVLETAVAVGELTKEGDKFITKTGKRFSLSEFTESLSSKWLTNDVLLKTLGNYSSAVERLYEICEEEGITATEAIEKYGDELEDFGLKAFKAAQEARTFSDVIASVKDAVSTGWMNTAEKIFGGYDESKVLWTELANQLYDVFAEGGNFRNEVLGLWRDLGGNNNVFGKHGEANQGAFWNIYDSIIAVRNIIRDAWKDVFGLSSFTEATERARDIAEKLNNLTKRIQEFTKRVKNSLENNMKLRFIFQGLFNVLKIGIQIIAGVVYALNPLIQLVKQLVSLLFNKIAAFGLNLSKIEGTASAIEEVARSINDILTDIVESIDLVGFLDKVFNLLGKIFKIISDLHPIEKLRKLILAVLGAFKGGLSGGVSGFFSALSRGLGKVVEIFGKGLSSLKAENVVNPIMSLFLGLSSLLKGVVSVLKPLTTILGQVLNFVGVVLQKFGEILSQLISAFNGEKVGKVVKVLLSILLVLGPLVVIALAIYNIVYSITTILSPLKNLFQAAADMMWDIGQSFKIKAMASILNSVALVLIAMGAAVAIMANVPIRGFVMALGALAAISLFVTGLLAFLYFFSKAESKMKGKLKQLRTLRTLHNISSLIFSISLSILSIALAIKMLSSISPSSLTKSVTSILAIMSGLFLMVVGFNKLLNTDVKYKKVEKLMSSIGYTVLSMSIALRIIGGMKTENIVSAIASVIALMGGILALVAGFSRLLTTNVNFVKVDWLMYSLSLAMINMAIALRIIGGLKDENAMMNSVVAMIALMASISGLIVAFGKLTRTDINQTKLNRVIFGLSLSLIAMATAIRIISTIPNISNVWTAVGALVVLMASMAVLMIAINKLGALIGLKTLSIVFGLIGLSAALLLLAMGLAAFAKGMSLVGNVDWSAFGKLAVSLLIINTLASSGIFRSTAIAIFGAALVSLGTGLASLSGGLRTLQGVDWTVFGKLVVAMLAIKAFVEAGAGIIGSVKIFMLGASLVSLGAGLAAFSAGMRELDTVEWGAIGKLLVYMKVVKMFAKAGIIKTAKILMFSTSLLLLSVALSSFAGSLKALDQVEWSSIGMLAVLFITIGTLGGVASSMAPLLAFLGLALVPLAAGLLLMAAAMKKFDDVGWESIFKTIVTLAASLTMLVVATKLISGSFKEMAGMLAISAAFAAVGAGMMIFAIAGKQLESVSWSSILKSIVLMAGAIILLVAATKILGPSTILVLALGAAVALLGAGMLMAALSLQVFAQSLPAFMEAIIENVELISTALTTIGPVLINALLSAFNDLLNNLSDIIPSIINLATVLIDGLLDILEQEGPRIIETVVTLVDSLANALADHSESIINALGIIVLNLLAWLKNNIKQISSDLFDILIGIIDALTEKVPKLMRSLREFLIALINALFDNIKPVTEVLVERAFGFLSDFIPKFIIELMKFTTVLVNALLVLLAHVLKLAILSLGTLSKLMLDFLAGLVLLLVHVFIGMNNIVFEALKTLAYNLFETLSRVLTFMVTEVPKLLGSALGKVIGAIVVEIGKIIRDRMGNLFGWGDAMIGWGEGIIKDANATFDQHIMSGDNVVSALNTARKNITSTMSVITNAIGKDVTDGVNEINKTMQDSLTAMGMSTSKEAKDVGDKVGDGLKTTMDSNWDDTVDRAKKAGEETGRGFQEGLDSERNNVTTTAGDVASDTIDTTKRRLGVASPSKVFASIGRFLMQGLALGIDEGAVEAQNSAVDSMNMTLMAVKNAVESDIDDEIVIRPVMDLTDVANGAQSISSIMSNVGNGRVSVSGELASSVQRRTGQLATEPQNQNGTTVVNNNETYNPVFNITSNDPDEVAREVDIRMQRMHKQSALAKGGAR